VAIGDIMGIQNIAIVNELGQVVNHVVADTDDTELIERLHAEWGTHRFVVTTDEDVIFFDESDDIWTTHCDDPNCDKQGFTLPEARLTAIREANVVVNPFAEPNHETVKINGRVYPADSHLIKENASDRPVGWTLPANEAEVSLADAE